MPGKTLLTLVFLLQLALAGGCVVRNTIKGSGGFFTTQHAADHRGATESISTTSEK
jgi:hypothetical protein